MGWVEDQFDWSPLAFCPHCCRFLSWHMVNIDKNKNTTTTTKLPETKLFLKTVIKRSSFWGKNLTPSSLGFTNLWPRNVLEGEGLKLTLVDRKSVFMSQHVAMCSTLMTLFVSNNRADEVILQLMFPGIWLDKCINPGGGRGLYGRITLVFLSYQCAGPRTTSAGPIPCVCQSRHGFIRDPQTDEPRGDEESRQRPTACFGDCQPFQAWWRGREEIDERRAAAGRHPRLERQSPPARPPLHLAAQALKAAHPSEWKLGTAGRRVPSRPALRSMPSGRQCKPTPASSSRDRAGSAAEQNLTELLPHC